ncbi:MAG: type II secretion system inner membrane protein GspF [Desulfobacteraceae bacterium]|nr:type II secretion system inner membrane protein GspF [Desulfobacteraceae bacterium]
MAVFEYKALDAKGKKASGIIDAESDHAAKTKLRQQKIFATSLKKVESNRRLANGKTQRTFILSSLFTRVSASDLSMITRQLSTLLSAGFPLVKAVGTLVPQTRSKTFQKVLSKVKDAIEEGNSFADALSLYPNVFSLVYINMVRAGESSGTLEIVLERLADFMEKKEDTKKKIQAALAYPVFMSLVGLGVLYILMAYVVPGIIDIFSDLNQNLPTPTRILISVSSFFESYWWSAFLIPFILITIYVFLRKSQKGAYFIDKVFILAPVTGNLLRKLVTARFTRTLASLLENGVPMFTALNITRSVAGNMVLYELISEASQTIEQGGELSKVLESSKVFPSLATQMIQVGEKSGEMEKMLEKTADLFEKDVQNAITTAASLISPLIILIMGVVVALIIFAICLPIIEINQLIQ